MTEKTITHCLFLSSKLLVTLLKIAKKEQKRTTIRLLKHIYEEKEHSFENKPEKKRHSYKRSVTEVSSKCHSPNIRIK